MRSLTEPRTRLGDARVVIGLGPGFEAGVDAHYVVESNRGPNLGEVITRGRAEPHTGIPGTVLGYRRERLLTAPRAGTFERLAEIGDFVEVGDLVGRVDGEEVRARLSGMIRGLKLSGVVVGAGHKVGDVDPRRDRSVPAEMTDKAQAVGRGVLRALEMAGQAGL
jgi:xanthine dehydrogenase accessory factor